MGPGSTGDPGSGGADGRLAASLGSSSSSIERFPSEKTSTGSFADSGSRFGRPRSPIEISFAQFVGSTNWSGLSGDAEGKLTRFDSDKSAESSPFNEVNSR